MKEIFSWASITKGIIGMILLIPASYFAFLFTLRVALGPTHLYYGVASSFLESNPDLLAFDKAAWILYGPAFCLLMNLPFRMFPNAYHDRQHWLNTAIALQAMLLFTLVAAWFFIQHYRYH